MKHKFLFACAIITGLFLAGCGGSREKTGEEQTSGTAEQGDKSLVQTPATDPKGIGKFKSVELTHPLDQAMVAKGKEISDVKCTSCHKLTEEKLVGPGWKGVTDRRTPEWIMNFVTNVEEMLDKDTEAQAMLELCMVRMPNQNLKDDEARAILEYMRKNDGKN